MTEELGKMVLAALKERADWCHVAWVDPTFRVPSKRGWYCIREKVSGHWWYSSALWDGYHFPDTQHMKFQWLDQGANNCL